MVRKIKFWQHFDRVSGLFALGKSYLSCMRTKILINIKIRVLLNLMCLNFIFLGNN